MRVFKYKDLTGLKFNRLTVIKESYYVKGPKKRYWKCLCDCGKTTTVQSQQLVSNKTRSCGCIKSELCRERCKRLALTNRKQGSWERDRISGIKRHARDRGYVFTLQFDEALALIKSPCHYCGILEIERQCLTRYKTKRLAIENITATNGIDRLDSSLGYTQENSVSCCGVCNVMKMDMSEFEFKSHVKKIYRHVTGM